MAPCIVCRRENADVNIKARFKSCRFVSCFHVSLGCVQPVLASLPVLMSAFAGAALYRLDDAVSELLDDASSVLCYSMRRFVDLVVLLHTI